MEKVFVVFYHGFDDAYHVYSVHKTEGGADKACIEADQKYGVTSSHWQSYDMKE